MGQAASRQEAFWEACGFGHTDLVRSFINTGTIDVNWISHTHNSCPIHVASQGKPDIVRLLIDAKCNVNAKDDRDHTALHHAAMKGFADIAQELIDAGVDMNAKNKNGWTALHSAAYWGCAETVTCLLDNGCLVNEKNSIGRTALHEVCRSQCDDQLVLANIAQQLIEAGCDYDLKSQDAMSPEDAFTPLMFAAFHGHQEVAEVLIRAGADVNSASSNGWTALHWASERDHSAIVKLLLLHDADVHLETAQEDTAVDRATSTEIRSMFFDEINDSNHRSVPLVTLSTPRQCSVDQNDMSPSAVQVQLTSSS